MGVFVSLLVGLLALVEGAAVLADALPGLEHVARGGGGGSSGLSKRQVPVARFCGYVPHRIDLLSAVDYKRRVVFL